jgi:hypothetical protein
MKKFGFLVAILALGLTQSVSVSMAGDASYGCCLIKTEDKTKDIWEYEDGVPFVDCYRSARLIGNPFEFLRNRDYQFHKDRRCASMRGQHELIPVLWSPEYRNG